MWEQVRQMMRDNYDPSMIVAELEKMAMGTN